MITSLRSFLEAWLVPLLQTALDPWHRFLDSLPPPVWRLAVCLYLVLGTVWACWLRRDSVFRGAPTLARWRDLRLWIPVLLLPYLLVYLLF